MVPATKHLINRRWKTLGLYPQVDVRITARCREVSKTRDSGLNFLNYPENWQEPRQ